MVHITYSTINECLLESTGPFTYSYYTIEVVSATVISINNPEKKKDVTAVINSLISKSTHHDTNSKLVVDTGKLNYYTGCDIDFGSRKKLEMQIKYGTPEHTPAPAPAPAPAPCSCTTPCNQPTILDGFTKRSTSLYYAITSPNGVDSSATLGENPNQSFRCLTNSTWSKYNGSGYVNFLGSKFTPDTERSSDYTCFQNTIFKEQIILTLPVDKNKPQISSSGDTHYQINALAFYRDEPVAQGIDQTLSSDGKAYYLTSDGKMIVEVIFKTADQAFVNKVKAEDKDSKLVVGNKVRTINCFDKDSTDSSTDSSSACSCSCYQPTVLDGFEKRSTSLYYAITSPNGVDSSATLGENPNQSFRCLTNSTWSKYNGSGYVNFLGSKFTPDTERSSDYTCIDNTIFKEQIILTLPVDKNTPQISSSGDTHYQINALAFYRDEPVAQGIDQTLSSDGKAFYLTSDGKMIVEVIFKTADQAFVDQVKAEDKDSKLVVGNKVRTINCFDKV